MTLLHALIIFGAEQLHFTEIYKYSIFKVHLWRTVILNHTSVHASCRSRALWDIVRKKLIGLKIRQVWHILGDAT